jgi:N-acetylmuramoyl-L-alanine amidase
VKRSFIVFIASFVSLLIVFLISTNEVRANGFDVMIDPGHGGSDPGAINYNTVPDTYEKVLNLQLASKVKKYLSPYVSNVYMTRNSDYYLSLAERAQMANDRNVDLFLSIHHDSSYSSVVNGVSAHYSSYRPALDKSGNYVIYNGKIYPYVDERKVGSSTHIFYKENGVTKSADINDVHVYDSTPSPQATKSSELALNITNNLASLGLNRKYTSTGVKDNIFYVVRWTKMPSVLVEAGFVSNPIEVLKLSDPAFQEKSAKKIADAVIDSFGLRKLDITNVEVSSSNNFEVDSPITFNTITQQSDSPLYKYWIRENGEWKKLQEYSNNSSFNWTPSKAGEYEFVVHAKNSSSSSSYDDYYTFNVTVKEKPVKLSVAENSYSNQDYTLSISSSNTKNKLFKYWVQYDGKWELISNYSHATSVKWTPPSGGEYNFVVHMKDESSSNSYDEYDQNKVNVSQNPIHLPLSSSLKEGVNTTLKAENRNGENYLYKYWVYDGVTWNMISDYTNEEVNWIPNLSGNVDLIVHAKKEGSAKAYDVYSKQKVNIADSNVTMQINSDKVEAFDDVEITTSMNDSGNYLYKYWIRENDSWVRLQNYSSDPTLKWTPENKGTYEFLVHVKNTNSTNSYDDYRLLTVDVSERNMDLKITPEDKNVVGLPINIEVENIFEGAHYKYLVESSANEDTLMSSNMNKGTGEYISSNTWSWTPAATGEVKVTVLVKAPGSTQYDYKVEKTITVAEPDKVKAENISVDDTGYPVNITANASGGTLLLYKFWSYNTTTKEWVKLKEYSQDNKASWSPEKPGEYQLIVHVKDHNSTKSYDSYKVLNYGEAKLPAAAINSFITTPAAQSKVGSPVKIAAEATADTHAQYKFWLKNVKTGEWTKLQDYNDNNQISWTPSSSGEFELVVHVKDAKSNRSYDDYKVLDFNVLNNEAIQVQEIVTTPLQDGGVGQNIEITATAAGSDSLLFKFWVYDKNKKTWLKLADYSKASTMSWIPEESGNYQLVVHVKDENSSKSYDAYKTYDFNVK